MRNGKPALIGAKAKIPAKTYTPQGKLVAFHLIPQEETRGGLVLPDGVADPNQSVQCLVIAVGPDCKQVKAGDEIILGNAPPMRCCHGDNITYLLNEEHIAGVVDKEFCVYGGNTYTAAGEEDE